MKDLLEITKIDISVETQEETLDLIAIGHALNDLFDENLLKLREDKDG